MSTHVQGIMFGGSSDTNLLIGNYFSYSFVASFWFCRYRVVDNLAGADIVVGEEEPKHKPPPLAAPPQSVLAGDALVRRCNSVCSVYGILLYTRSCYCKFV